MSYNGSGTFVINTAGQPVVSGTVISSTAFNALTADLATGLSTAITKDGQTTPTANIPMGNNKITNLAVGTAATDAANLSQVQSTTAKLVNSISGADTITGTMSPNLAAYATGQMFYFIAAGDNTGAVTLNIDSLGAKSVTRDGSVALAAGDIKSGEVVVVVYDGTRFQVVSQINSSGNATFANVSITSALNVGGVATFSAGTAAAPSITTSGDTNNGIFFPATDVTAITTAGSERLRVDASGNMGLGVTPSAWGSGRPAIQFGSSAANYIVQGGAGSLNVGWNFYYDGSVNKYIRSDYASQYYQYQGQHVWMNAPSGTAGNTISFTQAMTLTAGGDLALGTTTADIFSIGFARNSTVAVTGAGTTAAVNISGGAGSRLVLGVGSTRYGQIYQDSSNFMEIATTAALPIVFSTNNTEKARITSGGYSKFSNYGTYADATGTYHEMVSNTNNQSTTRLTHNGTSGTQYGLAIYTANDQNDATRYFLSCVGSASERATIRSNGGLANYSANNVNLASDERLKKDISPLASAWNKVKGMEVVNFRYKDCNEGDPMLYGVIAQQVQPVVPELVVVTREATETDPEYYGIREQPMYWLAIKALQEAMTKIETLEAKVAALEAK